MTKLTDPDRLAFLRSRKGKSRLIDILRAMVKDDPQYLDPFTPYPYLKINPKAKPEMWIDGEKIE